MPRTTPSTHKRHQSDSSSSGSYSSGSSSSGSYSSSEKKPSRSHSSTSSSDDTDSKCSSASSESVEKANNGKQRRHSTPTPKVSNREKNNAPTYTKPVTSSPAKGNDIVVTMPKALTDASSDSAHPSYRDATTSEPTLLGFSANDASNEPPTTQEEARISSKWGTLVFAAGGSAAVGVLFGKLFHWHETAKVATIIAGSMALGIAVWGLAQGAMACRRHSDCAPQPTA